MYIKMLVRGNILLRFRLVQKGAIKNVATSPIKQPSYLMAPLLGGQ